jgi:hypothetical protein
VFTFTRVVLMLLFVAGAVALYTLYKKHASKPSFPRYAPV